MDLFPPYTEMLATALHKAEDVFGLYLDDQRRPLQSKPEGMRAMELPSYGGGARGQQVHH
jgi:hypothetical protein